MNNNQVLIKTCAADTDYSGVIYHANYLKYCDYARTNWLQSRGVQLPDLVDAGYHFVVSHLSINYLKPAQFTCELLVTTTLLAARAATLNLTQVICDPANTATVYAELSIKLALVDSTLKPRRIPSSLREKIQ